jgi:hypothetical protein
MGNAPRTSTDANLACGFRIVGGRWICDEGDSIEIRIGNGIVIHRGVRTTATLIHCFQRKKRDFKVKDIEVRVEVVGGRG